MTARSHNLARFLLFSAVLLAVVASFAAFPTVFESQSSSMSSSGSSAADIDPAPASPQLLTAAVHAQTLPPALLASDPPEGASWAGQPVQLNFDQTLPEDVADRFGIEPSLAGSVSVDGAALTFTPEDAPEPGARYILSIAGPTESDAPQSVTLVGAYPLAVTATQPSSGAADVSADSQIVVIFNRPVVPLTGVDDQAKLPHPLTIEPALPGTGQWINTSVYAFRADGGLAGATEYTVTVDGVETIAGESLAEPFVFTFTTASPIVVGASPLGNQVTPDAVVRVDFSQPMDQTSTERAFSLSKIDDDASTPVDGEFGWEAVFTSLVFTPTETLEFGQSYAIDVSTDALPAGGKGRLREAFTSRFEIAPYPAVASIFPVEGAAGVSPDTNVSIRFNTTVSQTLALQHITVTPVLTTTVVYSYYSFYDNTVDLSWFKEPQTTYTITVGSEIADLYGNTLGEDYAFSFTTGDYTPFARLELERFTHFSADTPPRAGMLFRNIDSVGVELYRLPETELFKLTGSNAWEAWRNYEAPDPADNRIWRREYDTSGNLNVTVRQVITITGEAGDVLPAGAYMLKVDQPPSADPDAFNDRSRAVLILSDANLALKRSEQGESLAWLTDISTGEPVAETPVHFYQEGDLIGEGVTDASGLAMVRLNLLPERRWTPVVAISGEAAGDNYAFVSSEWSDGIAPWNFDISAGWGASPVQGYFYTDRPIYRPGHTVYWKGIVRELVDDDYRMPPSDMPIDIIIRDDMGNPILEERVRLGPNGTVHGELHLSPEARTGYYYLEASRLDENDIQQYMSGYGFQVAAYRTPEFEISVESLKEEYLQGDTVQIRVQARYFSGGALAGAPVNWYLISDPYSFNWSDPDQDRYYSFQPFDPDQAEYDPYSGSFTLGLIREGTGVTDASGEFIIELPADISRSLQSQNWTFDVTIQSPSSQFVSGRTSVPVHRAEYYIGLAPRTYLASAGEPAEVDLIAVTLDETPYPGAVIDAAVYEFHWNSVYELAADGSYRWSTSVERTPVFSTTLTTDRQGEAIIAWTAPKGGQYQITARGEDDAGNPTSSSAFVWVSAVADDEFVAWPRENNDRIELVADKQTYAPGESATILVPSPFTAPVQALVTIERGGVLEAEVITLTGNSETLEIPITSRHIPNIYVGVVLMKGVDETNPTPSMRVGYVKLPVDADERELDIAIEPSAETVRPGGTVTYTLTVRDAAGEAVPAAEVSVAIVDRAVLSLAYGGDQPITDAFYYERPLGVTTGVLLVINQDRVSQQLSEGAKGGGGGGGDGLEVRQDFADVAYWRADFITDENGEISFSVQLPDNLTTWRLAAKAVTDSTQVGEAIADTTATKELQLRPIAPRFFTAGDRAYIGAALVNSSPESIADGTISFVVTGAELVSAAPTEVSFTLEPGGQSVFTWPVEVSPLASEITLALEAGGLSPDGAMLADAVRLTIPVHRYESPETVSTAGSVPPEGATEAIYLPAAATDSGELAMTVEPSLASGLIEGLAYLAHYPYECNEQTVSRFLPNLMTLRAFQELDISDPDLENQLAFQLGIAVQRLVSRQNPDGGWGYWPGGESAPFISAYALWGLSTADAMQYTVPQTTLRNAVAYLEGRFQAPADVEASWQLNEMAFMHFVLSAMDQGDPGRASTLYDARERLDIYGKALLAVALANMEPSGAAAPRVRTLLDDIAGVVELSATGASWQEASIDYRTLNTNTRTTSIVLATFSRLKPDHPLLPQVVRWLMITREAGRWSTTQENAWAIIALTDWLAASGELEGDYTWEATLNDTSLGQGVVSPEDLGDPVQMRVAVTDLLRNQANVLNFSRSSALGQMYYTADLRYYLDATAVDSRDRGIVVDRSFTLLDGDPSRPISSAQVGDVVSVTVTIVAPTDLHHVLVEAPIPAGLEPIDPRLATTSGQFDMPSITDTGLADGDAWWWSRWIPSYTDIRDDKVALFATFLPAGAYQYTFNARAGIAGEYRVLPAYAEMMYFHDVWGRSSGALFTVTE